MSSLALQLIAENKRSRATFLDLGNCGLTEVPAEVGELVWLESLSLASEWYEWDGRAWQAKKSRNTGSDLPWRGVSQDSKTSATAGQRRCDEAWALRAAYPRLCVT